MKFCDNCNLLSDGDACDNCGNKNLREPESSDFCFFTEIDEFYGAMLEGALASNNIEAVFMPFYTNNFVTRGTAGRAGGRRVYVRFKDLSDAREIYDELFTTSDRA